jgi:hypothetical protein
MNAENRKIVQEAVREAGDYLKDKLPTLPQHQVRNSYAHLWRSIKEKMGKTYSECDDADLPHILSIVAKHRSEHS